MVREVRQAQLKLLQAIIGLPSRNVPRLPNSINIWGPHGSGKTYILNKALKMIYLKHIARVTAVEILCGRRAFLENIILQLRGSEKTAIRCDNLALFCQELISFCRKVSAECGGTFHERVIIIVDRVHLLADHPDILYALGRCQEFTHHNICVIFNSCHPLTTLSLTSPDLKLMPTVHFPQYTHDEITQIILHERPPGSGSFASHKVFVSTIVSMHQGICRDLTRLWTLANLHYAEFERAKSQDKDLGVVAFCRRLMPEFKKDFKNINSNEIRGSSVIFSNQNLVQDCMPARLMPKEMKLVLIAAYLASQNPTSSDRRFFVTARGPRKRKHSASNGTESTTTEPKTFHHARFHSICSKLMGKPVGLDTNFLVAITTLCRYKLLVRFDDSLDDCKYRCLAHRNLIEKISKTIGFPVKLCLACSP